jgi:hypothetical protein
MRALWITALLLFGYAVQPMGRVSNELLPSKNQDVARGQKALPPAAWNVSSHIGPPPAPRKFAALPVKDDGTVRAAQAFSELAKIEAEFARTSIVAAELDRNHCLSELRQDISKEEIGACFLAFQTARFAARPDQLKFDEKELDEAAALEAAITRFKEARGGANRAAESRLADLEFIKFVRADSKVRSFERQLADFKQRSIEWEDEAVSRRK